MGHEVIHQHLESHYGNGYLIKALHDISTNKHRAKAVSIVETHHDNFVGANMQTTAPVDIAWNVVSDYLQNLFTQASDIIGGISWRTLVELGPVPEHIDGMINRLTTILKYTRMRVIKAMNWVGRTIASLWEYLSSLLGPTLSSLVQTIRENFGQIDWLTNVLTSLSYHVIRQFSRGLLAMYTTMRSMVDKATTYMTSNLYGIMEGVLKTKSEAMDGARRMVTHTLVFFISIQGDVFRHALSPFHVLEKLLNGFTNQFAKMSDDFVRVVRSSITSVDMTVIENGLRNSWMYSTMIQPFLGTLSSIYTWIMDNLKWLSATLRRVKSVMRTVVDSMGLVSHIFGKYHGNTILQVQNYFAEEQKQSVELQKVRDTAARLATNTKLSAKRREQLQEAIKTTDSVLQDYSNHIKKLVEKTSTQSEKEQFRPNHEAAELLTHLLVDPNVIPDAGLVDRVFKHYIGYTSFDHFTLIHETLQYIGNVQILAVGDLLDAANILEKIGVKTDNDTAIVPAQGGGTVVLAQGDGTVVSTHKTFLRMLRGDPNLELDYDNMSTRELQERLVKAEKRLKEAQTALEEKDIEMRRRRNGDYYINLKKLESIFTATDISPEEMEAELSDIAFTLSNSEDPRIQRNYFETLAVYFNALDRYNNIVLRLKPRFERVAAWKGYFALIFKLLAVVGFYWIFSYFGQETPDLTWAHKNTTESQQPVGTWDTFKGIFQKTGLTGVNPRYTLNYKTWLGMLETLFGNVGVGMVVNYIPMSQYLSLGMATIPVTIATVGFFYFMATAVTSAIIDTIASIAYEVPGDSPGTTRLVYGPDAIATRYAGFVMGSARHLTKYALTKYVTAVIAILTGQIENVQGAGSLLISAVNGIANPAGTLMNILSSAGGLSASSFTKYLDPIMWFPSAQEWDRIIPYREQNYLRIEQKYYEEELRKLPEKSPLLTGEFVYGIGYNLQRPPPSAAPSLPPTDTSSTTQPPGRGLEIWQPDE